MLHRAARRLPSFAAGAFAGLALCATAQRQEHPSVFRSRVDVATVNVSILDGERPARGLGPGDVRVLEDGVERPVTFVLRPEDAPLDVAILLDASDSMARTGAPDDALRLLDGLGTEDCVLFLPFSDGIRERLWASPDDPRLRQAIRSVETEGATRLYDALVTAQAEMFLRTQDPETVARFRPTATLIQPFDAFRFRPVYAYMYRAARLPARDTACRRPGDRPRRRVILAVTDGLETAGAVTAIDALRAGWSTETPVCFISVKGPGGIGQKEVLMDERLWKPKAVELGPGLNIDPLLAILDYNLDVDRIAELLDHNLEAIAGTSGGQVFWDRSYQRSFARILDWLRTYHVIGYRTEPLEDGARRHVEVLPVDDRLRVQLSSGERSPRPTAETGAAVALATGLDELAQGRLESAAGELARAASLDPTLGSVGLAQALLALQQGRTDGVVDTLRRAIELAPWLPGPDFLLGSLYQQAGEDDLAWEHALHIYSLSGDRRLLDALAEAGSPPPGLRDRLTAPSVFLRGASMSRLDLAGARASDALLAHLGNAVREESRLRLASRPGADADLSLLLRDAGAGDSGALDAVAVLTAEGLQPLQEEIDLPDTEDADTVRRALEAAVASLADRYCDRRACS